MGINLLYLSHREEEYRHIRCPCCGRGHRVPKMVARGLPGDVQVLILSFLPREVWYGEWRGVRLEGTPKNPANLQAEYVCEVEVMEEEELWLWPQEPHSSYMLQESWSGGYWDIKDRAWGYTWRTGCRRPEWAGDVWEAPKRHSPLFTWQKVRRHQLWALGLVQRGLVQGSQSSMRHGVSAGGDW